MQSLKCSFLLLLILATGALVAQPSDAQILADIKKPGVLSAELTKTNGQKVWSSAHSQYFWERGAIAYRNAGLAEYPNAKIEIGGIARYTIVGNQFSYREFKVMWNKYLGIPTPTDEEVLEMVQANLPQFLSSYNYNKIVSELGNLRMADEPESEWHTANSFSINLSCAYSKVISYTEVADYDATYRVRFYRDAVKDPWKPNFISSVKEETETGRRTYSADEIRTMPTLGSREQEAKANAALADLPTVSIPQFVSDADVFLFIHKTLREGTPETFEAMMMQMMSPENFVEGSTVLLTPRGAAMINDNIRKAYEGLISYGDCYCADPAIKHRQSNMIEFWNKSKQVKTRIALGLYGGRYERGEKVGQEYKITALEVWTLTSKGEIDRMNSWPEDELCGSAGN